MLTHGVIPRNVSFMDLKADLLRTANAWATVNGVALSTASRRALDDSRALPRIQDDGRGITVDNFERAMKWFSNNWPAGVRWPAGVMRPSRARQLENA